MSNKGTALLIVVLVGLALVAASVFLFGVSTSSARSGPPGSVPSRGGPSVSFAASYQRTPAGVIATVVATSSGTEDLKDLRFTEVSVTSMSGGAPLPAVIQRLPRGAQTTFTLPFSGAVPSVPKSPLQMNLRYEYRYGWFGSGSGSTSTTTLLP